MAANVAPDPAGNLKPASIAHIQRPDGWIATTWKNMSDPGAFAVAEAEEQDGGEPPPLPGPGVVVYAARQKKFRSKPPCAMTERRSSNPPEHER